MKRISNSIAVIIFIFLFSCTNNSKLISNPIMIALDDNDIVGKDILRICAYQINDKSWYDSISDDIYDLNRMINCKDYDEKIISAKELLIHPTKDVRPAFYIKKEPDAKYIVFFVGYIKNKNRSKDSISNIAELNEKHTYIYMKLGSKSEIKGFSYE